MPCVKAKLKLCPTKIRDTIAVVTNPSIMMTS